MSNTLLLALYPELAEAETRTLTAVNHPELPPDTYAFAESYCDIRGCDCRRVIFNVFAMTTKEHVATIGHALDDSTPRHGLPRTFLDPMNTQTNLSQALLDELIHVILPDPDYQARLERHYRMFKEVVENPRHPLNSRLSAATPSRTIARATPKVGRNEPCPCGSGAKYKRCCLSAG